MRKTWDPPRVVAVLRAIKDNGVSVKAMTQLSGANRSTIYRWMDDENDGQPDYALVRDLARGIWQRHPDLARELVEASGWPWQEPEPQPEPLVDPQLVDALRRYAPVEADGIIAELERRRSGVSAAREDQAAS